MALLTNLPTENGELDVITMIQMAHDKHVMLLDQKQQYLEILLLAVNYQRGTYKAKAVNKIQPIFETIKDDQGYECFLSNVKALDGHKDFIIFQKDIKMFIAKLPSLYRRYQLDKDELNEFDLLPKKTK